MAIDFNRENVGSGYSRTPINNNFQNLDTALQDGLSRTGVAPNQMEADFDLNSNDLLNAKDVFAERVYVGGTPIVPGDVSVDPDALIPQGGTDGQVLTKQSATDYDVAWEDVPEGVPAGGTDGQVLTKQSGTDFDVDWETPSSSGLPTTGGTMTGPIEFNGPTAVLNDDSSVDSSPADFWYPDYFGNPGTGQVHRLNRLLLGSAVHTSSDTPPDTMDWLETLIGTTTRGATLAALSPIGNLGVLGAASTKHFRDWAGSASGGSQGVTGFGWNDDLTPATTPIAVGAEFRGFRKATCNGITLGMQVSAANEGSTVDTTAISGVNSGSTAAILITNGPGPTGYVNPIGAGIVFGADAGTMRRGIVFQTSSLDTSLGAGGAGIAIEFLRGMSSKWLNSGGTTDAEMYANASGLFLSANTVLAGSSLANYYSLSGSASTQPLLTVDGSSTDVDVMMQAKGLGTIIARRTDTATNTSVITHQLRHSLSSGTAAAGIGVGQNFVIVNASVINKIIATQEAITTDVTNGSEDADLVWKLMVAGAAAAEKLRLKSTGELNLATGGSIAVNAVKVLGARATGWTAATGTATRSTFATGSVTLPQLAERVKALIDDLITHGLIGT